MLPIRSFSHESKRVNASSCGAGDNQSLGVFCDLSLWVVCDINDVVDGIVYGRNKKC